MIITLEQHQVIHRILNRMLQGISGNPGIIFLYEGNSELGISEEEGKFLRAVMQDQGLVANADGNNQNHLSTLTAKGQSIATNPGGYLAYMQQQADQLEKQQTREREQFDLNRQGVTASVDSAKSAKISAWIAGLSLAVAIVAAYIAYQANAGSTDDSARIQKLEAQMQQLQRSSKNTAPLKANRP